jgi:hypothetical protein
METTAMAKRLEASTTQPREAPPQDDLQKRHTVAALVYFAYGVFYLFGAQYLTNMQATARGMSNPGLFFFLGGVITILFPFLIYSRFAVALSLRWHSQAQRTTLFVNFTLLLGLLVMARVVALLRGGLYAKTPWHTAALLIAAINAACLLWAGLGQPVWMTREPQGRAAEPPSAHAVAEGAE